MDAPRVVPEAVHRCAAFEVIEPHALATVALRRDWSLLDRNVCGIREIEPTLLAARVTLPAAPGCVPEVAEVAFYPEVGQIGVCVDGPGGASEPVWLAATSIEDGIARWLQTLQR